MLKSNKILVPVGFNLILGYFIVFTENLIKAQERCFIYSLKGSNFVQSDLSLPDFKAVRKGRRERDPSILASFSGISSGRMKSNFRYFILYNASVT